MSWQTYDVLDETPASDLMHSPSAASRFETTLYKVLAISALAIAALMLAFYLGVTYKAMFHSDSAMKLLLAEEMARQFTLFPRHWNYVNDILIIFPSLIAAPLSLIFPPSFPLHAFVDMAAAGLVLYAAYVASRALGIEGPLRLLVPTLLASGLSDQFVEATFGQSAYSGTVFILLLISGWGARYVAESSHGANRNRGLIGIAVLIVAGVAGGSRGLATYVAPLCAASASCYFLGGRDTEQSRRGLRLSIIAIAATIAGGLIFVVLSRILDFHEGAINQYYVGSSLVETHIGLIVSDWFNLFAALPNAGGRFSATTAAMSAFRTALALFLFFLPLNLLLRLGSITSARMRFLVVMHASLLAITLYMLVFTALMSSNGTSRYLVPLIPTALLIFAFWLQETFARHPERATQAGLGLSFAVLLISPTFLIAPAFSSWQSSSSELRENPHAAITEALRSEGLHRGFATYWNAGLTTVLSGGEVRVAPALLSDGGLMVPFHHLTAENWYAPEWAPDKTFLILDGNDSRQLNRTALDAVAGAPEKVLHVNGYEVLVYPFNVGQRMGFSSLPYVKIAPDSDVCTGDYTALDENLQVRPREFGALRMKITNRSRVTWSQNSLPPFNPGLRILDSKGKQVSEFRAALPAAVPPGGSTTLILPFRAPPAGEYTLQGSLVLESFAWCGNRTKKWASSTLSVKP